MSFALSSRNLRDSDPRKRGSAIPSRTHSILEHTWLIYMMLLGLMIRNVTLEKKCGCNVCDVLLYTQFWTFCLYIINHSLNYMWAPLPRPSFSHSLTQSFFFLFFHLQSKSSCQIAPSSSLLRAPLHHHSLPRFSSYGRYFQHRTALVVPTLRPPQTDRQWETSTHAGGRLSRWPIRVLLGGTELRVQFALSLVILLLDFSERE